MQSIKSVYENCEMYWNENQELHNENGPAVIWNDGKIEYWLFGNKYEEKSYKEYLQTINNKV